MFNIYNGIQFFIILLKILNGIYYDGSHINKMFTNHDLLN